MRRFSFTLIEILIVVMLITSGILPIYALLTSGRTRIARSEERTLATIIAVSVMELARTHGFEEADQLKNTPEFTTKILPQAEANRLKVSLEVLRVEDKGGGGPVESLSGKPVAMKQVIVTVSETTEHKGKITDTILTTILVDPRDALY